MQKSRRDFTKKAAIVVGATAVGTSTLAIASSSSNEEKTNGVVVGKSNKKEILYKESKAWDEFYKQAL